MTFKEIIDELEQLNKEHGVNLKGKSYTQVKDRLNLFRKHFENTLGIETEVRFVEGGALVQASITEPEKGYVLGSGHSFTSSIRSDKSIEKAETTAIGRALASFGFVGGEFASSNEMETHQERYNKEQIKPVWDDEMNLILEALEDARTHEELTLAKEKASAAKARMTDAQIKQVTDHINFAMQNLELDQGMERASG